MESPNRRSILKATASVGIIGGLAGCADNGDEEPPADEEPGQEETEGEITDPDADTGVRAAHLSPDAPNVDVYVDDEPILEDVGFGDVSEYLGVDAGVYDVQIAEAGDEETVFEDTIEVEDGTYTVAALGEVADETQPFDAAVFEDDLSDPGEEARLRVLHAAPDAPAVDIVDESTGDVLFEDLAFGEADAGTVPADDYTIAVQPAGDDDGEPVDTFDLTVESGAVYTGFAVGYLEPESAPVDEPFDLDVVEDAPADSEDDMD